MRAAEQAEAAGGGGAGQHRRDAEQQQVGKRVALALGPTRVGDPVQGGGRAGERHHGSSRGEGSTLNSSGAPPVPRPPAPPSQRLMARTEQPWRYTPGVGVVRNVAPSRTSKKPSPLGCRSSSRMAQSRPQFSEDSVSFRLGCQVGETWT